MPPPSCRTPWHLSDRFRWRPARHEGGSAGLESLPFRPSYQHLRQFAEGGGRHLGLELHERSSYLPIQGVSRSVRLIERDHQQTPFGFEKVSQNPLPDFDFHIALQGIT